MLHSFRKRILSICDTREILKQTKESTRRDLIASRDISLQYVIREKASGGRKNQVVEAPSLQNMYPFNMWYTKKPQAKRIITQSTFNCLRQMSDFTVEDKKPQANWRITLEKSICLRLFRISSEEHQFAWGFFAFPVKNINLPKAIWNFQCDSSICLKQFRLASVIQPLA